MNSLDRRNASSDRGGRCAVTSATLRDGVHNIMPVPLWRPHCIVERQRMREDWVRTWFFSSCCLAHTYLLYLYVRVKQELACHSLKKFNSVVTALRARQVGNHFKSERTCMKQWGRFLEVLCLVSGYCGRFFFKLVVPLSGQVFLIVNHGSGEPRRC